jgi:hypothetical protein
VVQQERKDPALAGRFVEIVEPSQQAGLWIGPIVRDRNVGVGPLAASGRLCRVSTSLFRQTTKCRETAATAIRALHLIPFRTCGKFGLESGAGTA